MTSSGRWNTEDTHTVYGSLLYLLDSLQILPRYTRVFLLLTNMNTVWASEMLTKVVWRTGSPETQRHARKSWSDMRHTWQEVSFWELDVIDFASSWETGKASDSMKFGLWKQELQFSACSELIPEHKSLQAGKCYTHCCWNSGGGLLFLKKALH